MSGSNMDAILVLMRSIYDFNNKNFLNGFSTPWIENSYRKIVLSYAKNVLKSILESETGPFIFDTKNRRV